MVSIVHKRNIEAKAKEEEKRLIEKDKLHRKEIKRRNK